MISAFKPHIEVLPSAQQRLWPLLRPAASLGLVLYGGTAIALRLGHRNSVDFDFFTDRPLDRLALKAAFPFLDGATILQEQPQALTVLIAGDSGQNDYVKVSFFGTVSIGRVGKPEMTEDRVLQVASLDDLMATRVKVILQRIEAKDYQDIAALVRADVSLVKGLAAACAIYGHEFQPSEALKALVYFEGGDLHNLSRNDKEALIKAVSAVRDLPPVVIVSHSLSSI